MNLIRRLIAWYRRRTWRDTWSTPEPVDANGEPYFKIIV